MSALQYPFGDTLPAAGTAIEVAPGVRWLRMPLPFALDHINLWLLRDRQDGRDGWAIVDCGIADDATRAAWDALFATGLDGLPVLRVIVTHLHPDHVGLADWLTRRWTTGAHDCRLWMSATDWLGARLFAAADSGVGGEASAHFYARHGLTDPGALARVRARGRYYADMVPAVPARFARLMDGLELDCAGTRWRCIAGYGHAPEHISLYSDALGVLVSGDMILPRISTNVSVIHNEPESNPLPLFLRSIARLRELPADTLVLPSHGKPFRGLHVRIGELEAHHEARLGEVRAACAADPRSAAELLQVLFRRKLDLHQTTFAMGEAIAHLHTLAARGEIVAATGADGVVRFAAASAA
jgi:glyoxylase-like metal-dependent hydrolase (beta-lactamase superfamily II)